MLESGAHLSLPHGGSEYLRKYQDTERKEVARYNDAREKVKTEILSYKQKMDAYDEDHERLRQEVAELEAKLASA